MKIEDPPRYFGKRQLGVHVWLTQLECYIKLMKHSPSNWLGIVAIGVEGVARCDCRS